MEINAKEVHTEELNTAGLTIKLIVTLNSTNKTYWVFFKAYDKEKVKVWETELRGANNQPIEFRTLQEAVETARNLLHNQKNNKEK